MDLAKLSLMNNLLSTQPDITLNPYHEVKRSKPSNWQKIQGNALLFLVIFVI